MYAVLKAVHLLAVMAWIGGMFFTLACLRPALAQLDGPARQRLMVEVLRRFFAIVNAAIGVLLVSGGWMFWLSYRAAAKPGLTFNMPLDWYAMLVLGVAMFAIFGYVRAAPFRQLQRAVQARDGPAGVQALGRIRRGVGANLVLGVIVVVVMKLGAA